MNKGTYFAILLISIINFSFSNKYELMESKGDSESYNLHSKSNLNSQSKFNFIFAPSHKLSNNLENKLNSINSKVVTIKSYSSYQTATAYDNVRRKPKFKLKRNSVYAEVFVILPSINYEHIFAVNSNLGITMGAGILVIPFSLEPSIPFIPLSLLDIGIIYGKKKHFIEAGLKLVIIPFIKVGYRYVSDKNFYIRAGIILPTFSLSISEIIPALPSFSFGYMF